MRIDVPLGFPLGKGRSTAAGMQSLCNLYGEPIQRDGKTQLALYTTPGRLAFSTINNGAIRGAINTATTYYVVAGTSLYSVDTAGTATSIGTVEGADPVDMTFNGVHVFIVAELKSYTYNVSTLAFAEVADADFVQASACDALATYIVVARNGTGQFAWSAVADGTAWDALDFATAEAEADNLVFIRRKGNEIVLGGSNSTEVWGLTGDSNAPFARVSTQAVTIGCASRDSACLVDNGLVWVGRDGKAGGLSVYRMDGYIPKIISDPNVSKYLEAVSDPTLLRAFTYQQGGHQFYVLTNPSEWTLVWDVLTGQWSYRRTGSFAMGAEPSGGWDAVTYALNGTKQIVGSADGNLYQLSLTTLTDNGEILVRECTTPNLWAGGRKLSMDRLTLEIQAGIGLSSGQGSDPKVMMSCSKDGGQTWSTPVEAGMGVSGDTKHRAFWTRIGQYEQIMFKFRTTDPVTTVYLGAWGEVS